MEVEGFFNTNKAGILVLIKVRETAERRRSFLVDKEVMKVNELKTLCNDTRGSSRDSERTQKGELFMITSKKRIKSFLCLKGRSPPPSPRRLQETKETPKSENKITSPKHF